MNLYSDYVKDLCETKTAIGLSRSSKSLVEPLLTETSFLDDLNPSYTIRAYCVKNNIHEIPKCEHCGGNTTVNSKDNKLGFNRFCSDLCRKSAPKLAKDVLKKLESKDWMYEQRIVLKKSKDTIAIELGISHVPVNKWLKIHGIEEVKYNTCQIDVSNTLMDYEWLYEKYVTNKLSTPVIADMCGVGVGIVLKYIKAHAIPVRNGTESQLSEHAISKLSSKEWLYNEYVTNRKSMYMIADFLGCSASTVKNYILSHNMTIRNGSESMLSLTDHEKLLNYDWMYDCYVTNKMSTRWISDILDCSSTCVAAHLKRHGIEIRTDNSVSSYEISIRNYLDTIGVEYVYSNKSIIAPYEIDIYFPTSKIALEINGVYWHSEVYKSNDYHKMKTNICKDLGIRLIHIYEDDIVNRFDIVKRIIKNAIGVCDDAVIYARKCDIIENYDKSLLHDFFTKYHIQGYVNHSYNICLEYNGEIVAAMLFKGIQLVRYTTSCKVIGGLSKLTKNSPFEEIETFLDIQTFSGEAFFNNGYVIIDELPIDYRYLYNDVRVHKFNFRKNRFKNDPKLSYDENLTEKELARLNKIYRVYDCGKYKLKWCRQ